MGILPTPHRISSGTATPVAKSILSAFSDQLAIRLGQGTLSCRLVGNRKGTLDPESCVKHAAAFVACEITEIEARETTTRLRLATAIELPWLEELFPDEIETIDGANYDESRRRVTCLKQKKFRDLVLESKETDQNVPLDAAAEILAKRVLTGELVLKNWDSQVEQFTHRLACISKWMPDLGLPTWTEEDRIAAVSQICHGAVSYKEIKNAPVWPVLNDWLSSHQRHLLDTHCPERIHLASGHSAKITYSTENDPFFSAKLAQLKDTNANPHHRLRPHPPPRPHPRPEQPPLADDQGHPELLAKRLPADEKGTRRPLPPPPLAVAAASRGRPWSPRLGVIQQLHFPQSTFTHPP